MGGCQPHRDDQLKDDRSTDRGRDSDEEPHESREHAAPAAGDLRWERDGLPPGAVKEEASILSHGVEQRRRSGVANNTIP